MSERVKAGTDRWNELVRVGNEKVSDTNWFLGDAALEIAPMGEDNSNNGAMADVEQYAGEVDVLPGNIRVYRDVASAWPPPRRLGGVSFGVHDALKAHQHLMPPDGIDPDTDKPITVAKAREAVAAEKGGAPKPQSGEAASPEARTPSEPNADGSREDYRDEAPWDEDEGCRVGTFRIIEGLTHRATECLSSPARPSARTSEQKTDRRAMLKIKQDCEKIIDYVEQAEGAQAPERIEVRDAFENPKARHGLKMLAPLSEDGLPIDTQPHMKRLITALQDIGTGENPDLAYLHACQAASEIIAAWR